MTLAAIQESIIPGYCMLSSDTKAKFEVSQVGQQFVALVEKTLSSTEELAESAGFVNWLFGYEEEDKQQHEERFKICKAILLDSIKDSKEYKELIAAITSATLSDEFPAFDLLDEGQRILLSGHELAQALAKDLHLTDCLIAEKKEALLNLSSWDKLTQVDVTLNNAIETLSNNRVRYLETWTKIFYNHSDFKNYRETIVAHQIEEISDYFPHLNYGKPSSNQQETKPIPNTVEDDLSSFYFHHLQEINKIEIDFINLDEFNKEQAKLMAAATLQTFKDKTQLDLEQLTLKYQLELLNYLKTNLTLIDGVAKKTEAIEIDFVESISFLWRNPVADKIDEFVGSIATAHAFIQATSFSTQNENSILAILDMYNYGKCHKQITEVRKVLVSLIGPLKPLYQEYKEIGLCEKNVFKKYFRMLMPVVIVVAVIVLISVLFTPLGLSELALAALFVPSLLIGLGVATMYCSTKNNVYKFFREAYYGGAYEIPEFQINARMVKAFGNETNAKLIREFYIAEIRQCDELEKQYHQLAKNLVVSEEGKTLREENKNKRHTLALEWYDIHSNPNLGYDKTPKIALNALAKKGDSIYADLVKSLQEEDKSLRDSIESVAQDLKNNLKRTSKPVVAGNIDPVQYQSQSQYHPRLFKAPKCLEHREKIQKITKLSEEISSTMRLAG